VVYCKRVMFWYRQMIRLFFLILINLNLYAINIDSNTSGIDILSKSYIYIDKYNAPDKTAILDKEFKAYHKDAISLGYVDMSALWIRFTLKNIEDKPLTKLLEYDNQEVEDIYFYDGLKKTVDGEFHMREDRFSINPSFEISLKPHEEIVYYIKAHSRISSLIGKLVIWNKNDFILNDQKHKLYLFVFFTIIITLLLYNFMIYIFTKDKAYMYYVIYLFGIVIFQGIYLGMAPLYFFSNTISLEVSKATFAYISLLVVPIILFTIEFLNMYKFERLNGILKTYLYISPIIIILSYDNIVFNLNVMALYIPLGFIIIFSAFYALYKGEKQAKFYIAGWSFVIVSLIMSVVKSLGLIDITKYFYYANEVAFVLEALLFSVALAHRIKILAQQKYNSDIEIMKLQEERQERLSKLVNERTQQLEESLYEKDTLYKELNHRVKNNLQMVISLLNLQISKTKLSRTKNELIETKNRIISISNLYENLNVNVNERNVSTHEYCKNIVNNLNNNFLKKIEIECHIDYELDVDQLVYFGLIINELVTNSMKYAFDSNILTKVFKSNDEISIQLYKEKSVITLVVEDNGIGFEDKVTDSLGLEIVKTLVLKQLLGDLSIESENGTKVIITWEDKNG